MTETIHNTPLTALKLYENNPRIGNIQAIADSLQTNGQYKPIVVRRETREILVGNHTYQAAQTLGWETIKTVYVENITDEQALKIVLADNRTSDLSTYNNHTLAELLQTIQTFNGTGFTNKDAKELAKWNLNDITQNGQTDPDDAPRVAHSTTITNPGDLWTLGNHTLLCGTATEPASYQKLLNGQQVDLLLTDPPYNVNYEGSNGLTIQNDNMGQTQFEQFLRDFYTNSVAHMKEGAAAYIFHADSSGHVFRNEYLKAGLDLKEVLVWVKNSLVLSRQDYHWQHEPILYGWKPGAAHHWYGDRTYTTVIDHYDPERLRNASKETLIEVLEALFSTTTIIRHPKPARNLEHPTIKPVELLEQLIKNSTQPTDLILDPFAGSGSTLIAAYRTSRTAKLIELDPKYCDVICKRWEQHTGNIPILTHTGEEHSFTQEEE